MKNDTAKNTTSEWHSRKNAGWKWKLRLIAIPNSNIIEIAKAMKIAESLFFYLFSVSQGMHRRREQKKNKQTPTFIDRFKTKKSNGKRKRKRRSAHSVDKFSWMY